MKKIFTIALVSFVFSACIKEKNEGECQVSRYTMYDPNGVANEVSLDYDGNKRLVGLRQSNFGNLTLTYYEDSVVLLHPNDRTVFYLNNMGLADSSATIFLANNPNGLAFRRHYTYFPEGFMKTEQEIFSQVYNGSVIRDTSHKTFTINNGNITSINFHNGLMYEFKYSEEIARNNRLLHPLVFGEYPFLGKTSRNLIKTQIINSFAFTNYTYQVHGNGTVSKMTASSAIEGLTYKEFVYQCR